MSKSDDHIALSQIAAVFLRETQGCWAVAVEPRGIGESGDGKGRDYDVLGLRPGTPRAIIGVETKVTRVDFKLGLKKGQFDQRDDITELWLCYPGHFSIKELPSYVGVLSPRSEPLCVACYNKGQAYCDCEPHIEKPIYLKIAKQAKPFLAQKECVERYNNLSSEWLYRIATANTTMLNYYLKGNIG